MTQVPLEYQQGQDFQGKVHHLYQTFVSVLIAMGELGLLELVEDLRSSQLVPVPTLSPIHAVPARVQIHLSVLCSFIKFPSSLLGYESAGFKWKKSGFRFLRGRFGRFSLSPSI